MADQRNSHRRSSGRARFRLLPLALSLAGCPQMLDDDFTIISVVPDAGGQDGPAAPTLDASAPGEPSDAGTEADASASGPADAGDAGVGDDAGDAGAGQDAGVTPSPDAGEDEPPPCVASTELCDGRDNDCDELVDELTACADDCVGLTLEGRGAMYCGGPGVDFVTAAAACDAEGMRLVASDSAEKNAAIVDAAAPLYASLSTLVEEQDAIWIDARDSQTEGTWLTGEAGSVFWIGDETGAAQNGAYVNWGTDKPNNNGGGAGEDCGMLYVGSGSAGALGSWNDHVCSVLHTFLCEAPAP